MKHGPVNARLRIAAHAALASLALAAGAATTPDTFSDTWVATDGLGRSLPGVTAVGPPRTNRFVGIFYFLWHGRHGDAGPFDISRILAADPAAVTNPASPPWGPLLAPHHWGESWFGHYVSDDEAVLAKHAQMLADAGVDTVIFDVTNQLTYPESWQALGRVWQRIRDRGGRTPQIAFLGPFGEPRKVVRELYDTLYAPGLHPDLWFRWRGKPLILADPDLLREHTELVGGHDLPARVPPGGTLGQSFTADRPFTAASGSFPTWAATNAFATLTLRRDGPGGPIVASHRCGPLRDNAWESIAAPSPQPPGRYSLELSEPQGPVGWWTRTNDVLAGGQAFADGGAAPGDRTIRIEISDARTAAILNFFTFRSPQPDYFAGPRRVGDWGWLEVHPQHAFRSAAGTVEEVAVGAAQNADGTRLSVFSNPHARGRSFHDGRQPGPAGTDFTGRNFAEQWARALELDPEFVFVTGWNEWVAGRYNPATMPLYGTGPVTFVDTFSLEYSRDIEPMKGGHEDAYYYQMVAQIRRYKGARPPPPVHSQPIAIDGRFDDWAEVAPEFRDDAGDPVQRDHRGWGRGSRYIDRTGRRDLVTAKVARNAAQVCFLVRTRGPMADDGDVRGLLLFLDTDRNPTNGWLGYDVVINRTNAPAGRLSVERHTGAGWGWTAAGTAVYGAAGDALEVAVPRALTGPADTIDFKWADNLRQTGEASDFTLHGDAAPNDRFNYRAVFGP